MTTLHLEVHVVDLSGFKAGFAADADAREKGGVRNAVVRNALGDESRLVIDLDFDSAKEAEAYLRFLQEQVWPQNQTILAAPPEAAILEPLSLV